MYDESGSPIGFRRQVGTTSTPYYYVKNLQGDIVAIARGGDGAILARYAYDAWGNILSITDNAGHDISNKPNEIANINPLRYRGYYYDSETGLYYLQSRFYDPATGRFVNADGYASTGQGILSHNMFVYCANNPVNRKDPAGQFWITALVVTVVVAACAIGLSGCSVKSKQEPEPYKSADEAAKAFSEQVYSSSAYIRHEYSTEIYSRTINGETTYNYNPPRVGQPHSASVGQSTPKGTKPVAYAHTHPNSNAFSGMDIRAAESLGIDAYVVGPNLKLQRYNLSSATITKLDTISPIALTVEQQNSLVTQFQVSWDTHVAAGCEFGCNKMIWPTP